MAFLGFGEGKALEDLRLPVTASSGKIATSGYDEGAVTRAPLQARGVPYLALMPSIMFWVDWTMKSACSETKRSATDSGISTSSDVCCV